MKYEAGDPVIAWRIAQMELDSPREAELAWTRQLHNAEKENDS